MKLIEDDVRYAFGNSNYIDRVKQANVNTELTVDDMQKKLDAWEREGHEYEKSADAYFNALIEVNQLIDDGLEIENFMGNRNTKKFEMELKKTIGILKEIRTLVENYI
jgi:hypothetical protein